MKRLFLAAAIIASLNCFGQEKPKVDSSDIPLISIKDLDQTLADYGKKVTKDDWFLIKAAYEQVLMDAIKRKQAKPKK